MKSIEEMRQVDHMSYMEGMDVIDSDIPEKVLREVEKTDFSVYTREDVIRALGNGEKTIEDYKALLSPAAGCMIEEMALAAKAETEKHFGNSVYLFTPLYIANYCENYCIYCGFNCYNKIHRAKLSLEDVEKEMSAISATGIEEILILTGESRKMSDVKYIGKACEVARKYFKNVGIEVYPMNVEEYRYLHECGADFVTVFQETYDSDKYETLHLQGHKRVYPYRFNAQERAVMGGMRGVAFAALLGLADFRKDALAVGLHAYFLQRKYPHAEISFSCPRLRPIINNDKINPKDVHEKELLQVMCAYRLFMPFAGLTISTRERKEFRNNVIGMCATKISAGVSTGIGSHTDDVESQGDDQFEIADTRSLDEVVDAIKDRGLQPVMNDYVFI